MGNLSSQIEEYAAKQYDGSVKFDSCYLFEKGQINGQTNSLSLKGRQTVCFCFVDVSPEKYNVTVEKGSEVSIYTCFIENSASEIYIDCEEDTSCEHIVMQQNTSSQQIFVVQKCNSVYNARFFQLKGKNDSIKLDVKKDGEFAQTELSGVFFPKSDEQFSILTKVSHEKPNCETQELFRGIADENGSGSFSGLIYVAKDAQKTSARQQNRNILLSKNAHIHSEPQLEIYADDVVCNHGSSTGQIDEEALWYMQTRGINKTTAIKLLVSGFANDVLEKISNENFRNLVAKRICERLQNA